MRVIELFTVTIVLVVYSGLMIARALTKLWTWFIVPTFKAPPLSIAAAIGLVIVVGYMVQQSSCSKKEGKGYGELLLEGFIEATIKPLMALLLGCIVKMWM